ncbi:maleylpyruvate isomerase N-terminal domain-containing protein [Streptomyces sp. A1136]|uniref:maleylpyruvate isomerase N-terminal domain-containing protein n=1 Tax=Streptomyces sp. A1136 TaxID=2563102 RepID=UPI00109E6FA6|nr:maleylpyruvate isomerase N-terminal domain-containing protein [Streptomyces sp. A1136]THA47098.1 hypothetical protein E6R62_32065 [Streptomyces sp. A1136]
MLDIIEEVTRSGRITSTLDALTDTDVREPSALPGWTRGHVITRLALVIRPIVLWRTRRTRSAVSAWKVNHPR